MGLFIIIQLIVILLLLINTLRIIKIIIKNKQALKITSIVTIIISIAIIALIIYTITVPIGSRTYTLYRIFNMGLLFIVIPQMFLFIINIPIDIAQIIKRKRFRKIRIIFTSVLGIFMMYIIINAMIPDTNYQITRQIIKLENIPKSFDNFKIIQISDIHIGSLSKTERTALETKLVNICNELSPDIIALTGDVINSHPNELINNEKFLSRLKAKYGKYFIYGNHDIGLYNRHLSEDELNDNINLLKTIMQRNDFIVLKDSLVNITKEQDYISLIGVQELYDKDYNYYYIDKYNALTKGISENDFLISLSHNPSYYNYLKKTNYPPSLTLAGHTHAMQVEILGWSPSDIIHEYSRGMYKINNNYMYVNRGIGYHFYRRIGSLPEITLIELHSK